MGIVVEATEISNSVGDVWASHGSEILESAYSREIWHSSHFLLFSFCGHERRELSARSERSGNGIGLIHTESPKEVVDVVGLGKGDRVSSEVLLDLEREEEGGRTQVTKLEVLLELLHRIVHSLVRVGQESDIVNIDRSNDLHVTSGEDVDGVIALETFEAKEVKDRVKLLVPLPSRLLKAIERLVELANDVRTSLVITLRLTHIDLLIELAIGEG